MRLDYGGRARTVSDTLVASRGDEKALREVFGNLEKYAL